MYVYIFFFKHRFDQSFNVYLYVCMYVCMYICMHACHNLICRISATGTILESFICICIVQGGKYQSGAWSV